MGNQQSEILGLKSVIVAQENLLAQKINENNENLKKMIAENSTYFQGEINKINSKFEENERRTELMIEKALKAERERQEKLARDKSNVPQNESNLAGASLPTPVVPLPWSLPSSSRPAIPVPARLDNGRPSEAAIGKEKEEPKENKEDEKPEKFIDANHEKHWELNVHKKKLIMKIERVDITKHIADYNLEVSDEYVFKNPVIYDAREAGVKEKIFNATGIPPKNWISLG